MSGDYPLDRSLTILSISFLVGCSSIVSILIVLLNHGTLNKFQDTPLALVIGYNHKIGFEQGTIVLKDLLYNLLIIIRNQPVHALQASDALSSMSCLQLVEEVFGRSISPTQLAHPAPKPKLYNLIHVYLSSLRFSNSERIQNSLTLINLGCNPKPL